MKEAPKRERLLPAVVSNGSLTTGEVSAIKRERALGAAGIAHAKAGQDLTDEIASMGGGTGEKERKGEQLKKHGGDQNICDEL